MSEPDASQLPKDWAEALARHGFVGDADQLVSDIYGTGATVFPPPPQVFRAFHLTNFNDVRVVILGQDPYPRQGQANGLAFSFDGDASDFPRSLKAIYDNAKADDDVEFRRPGHGDLSFWAKQGVLLLNSTLTVQEATAGSAAHRRHWKHFTDCALRAINEERERVVFLLFGSPAIRKARAVPVDEERHALIRTAHPAAWTTKSETLFKHSRPFSEANNLLRTVVPPGPVNWDLTAAS